MAPCPHGRRRSICKECGGKGICPHGRRRYRCKECGGGSICIHDRQRHQCKECGGGSICIHGRRRYRCKECGGKGICTHDRVRSQCKECGGGHICTHGRVRSQCKECGGKTICAHGRIRSKCKECKRTSLKHKIAANSPPPEKKPRPSLGPMCQPTQEPHQPDEDNDEDTIVIDGFVVQCSSSRRRPAVDASPGGAQSVHRQPVDVRAVQCEHAATGEGGMFECPKSLPNVSRCEAIIPSYPPTECAQLNGWCYSLPKHSEQSRSSLSAFTFYGQPVIQPQLQPTFYGMPTMQPPQIQRLFYGQPMMQLPQMQPTFNQVYRVPTDFEHAQSSW